MRGGWRERGRERRRKVDGWEREVNRWGGGREVEGGAEV